MNRQLQTEILVLEFQMGDVRAFERLFQLWEQTAIGYARAIVRSHAAADDVMQEVWLSVARKLNRLDDPECFRPWLLRAVVNRSRDYLRAEKRKSRLTERVSELARSEATVADDPANVDPNDRFERLMAQLPERDRLILSLRYEQDQEITEIARMLGIPPGTVKSRLYYARKKAKSLIEEIDNE